MSAQRDAGLLHLTETHRTILVTTSLHNQSCLICRHSGIRQEFQGVGYMAEMCMKHSCGRRKGMPSLDLILGS